MVNARKHSGKQVEIQTKRRRRFYLKKSLLLLAENMISALRC